VVSNEPFRNPKWAFSHFQTNFSAMLKVLCRISNKNTHHHQTVFLQHFNSFFAPWQSISNTSVGFVPNDKKIGKEPIALQCAIFVWR